MSRRDEQRRRRNGREGESRRLAYDPITGVGEEIGRLGSIETPRHRARRLEQWSGVEWVKDEGVNIGWSGRRSEYRGCTAIFRVCCRGLVTATVTIAKLALCT